MENLNYLFAAFAVVWTLLFYYVHRMGQKQKELIRDLEALRTALENKKPTV